MSAKTRGVKIFKLEEANALVPVIRPALDKLVRRRRDLAIALLEADVARAFGTEPSQGRDPLVLRRDARELQEQMLGLVEMIQRHGCIVKDIDLGLVDFPALRGGQLVNLCWKLGEPEVKYWHGIEEGFAARKPLTRRRST